MKVLILSQYFWPESFRISEVAQSLRAEGCEVSVLTGQPNYPEGKVFAGYRAWSTFRETYAQCNVHRVPLFPRGPGGALRLVGNYLSFVVSASLIGHWLLRSQRFDVIFVYGISPILQVLPGFVLRHTTGATSAISARRLAQLTDGQPARSRARGDCRARKATSDARRHVHCR